MMSNYKKGCQQQTQAWWFDNERKLWGNFLSTSHKPLTILSRSHIYIFQWKGIVIKKVDHEQISIWYGYHDWRHPLVVEKGQLENKVQTPNVSLMHI
jgi:hypothetical protein